MNYPLVILGAVGTVGAVDVLYFHLYRFRLFAQAGSVGEEITHLFRQAIFVALIVLLSSGASSASADAVVIGLFALDMVNSAVDVLLERRSRERLGGLPSAEYLVHIVSSFGMGLAVAAYVFARGELPLPVPDGFMAWQVRGMLAAGVLLVVVELSLFARAVAHRGAVGFGSRDDGGVAAHPATAACR
jgi:hypothetical protein